MEHSRLAGRERSQLMGEEIGSAAPGSIALLGVSKHYRLYARPVDRLFELLFPGRVGRGEVIRALDDVTLSIRPGERIGILGRNGSGKSTLLKAISGVITPSGGEVRVAGRVAALLELGIGFSGELTGRENIRQYGLLHGLTREEIGARHDEIVAFAELGEFIEQPIRTYSSGMILRLAFACAVFSEPDILIIDEALSVGDSYFQVKCLHRIRAMLERGITFLYVSHSADSVRGLCERGLLMEEGRIVLDGGAEAVAREYERRAFLRASALADSGGTEAGEAEEAPATPEEREFARRVAALRSGSGKVRATRIEVLNEAGEPVESIPHDAIMRLCVGYRVHDTLGGAVGVTVGICDRLGTQILHFNSLDKGIDLAGAAPGEIGSVSFSFQNVFCPGEYSVIVGIGDMERNPNAPAFWMTRQVHDYCIGGAVFSVPAASAKSSLWGLVGISYGAERRREGERVEIALPGLPRFEMRVHAGPDLYVSQGIARERVWEPFETRVVRELLRHVDIFVDVGANIGWYSVVAGLALGDRGRVLAFEPDPDNFALLSANLAANGLTAIVRAEPLALADEAGERWLFRSPDNLGDHRLHPEAGEERQAVPVRAGVFDEVAAPHIDGPCVVKLDTQGSEALVLAGMRRHLAAHTGDTALLVEFWPFGLAGAGSAPETLLGLFSSTTGRLFIVDERREALTPITAAELAARAKGELRPAMRGFLNLLWLPFGHPAEAALAALPIAVAEPTREEERA